MYNRNKQATIDLGPIKNFAYFFSMIVYIVRPVRLRRQLILNANHKWKQNFLKKKTINGVKNIQTSGYNGTHTVA